jgi:hypothetical protein
MLRWSEIKAKKVLATCVIVAITCVFGATNPVMLPDIAGQRCILTTEIAGIATRRLAILLSEMIFFPFELGLTPVGWVPNWSSS